MHLAILKKIKYKNGLFVPLAMHVYIYLNQMINKTTSLPLQTNLIYSVVVEDLDLHYKPSLFMYWLLTV